MGFVGMTGIGKQITSKRDGNKYQISGIIQAQNLSGNIFWLKDDFNDVCSCR